MSCGRFELSQRVRDRWILFCTRQEVRLTEWLVCCDRDACRLDKAVGRLLVLAAVESWEPQHPFPSAKVRRCVHLSPSLTCQ